MKDMEEDVFDLGDDSSSPSTLDDLDETELEAIFSQEETEEVELLIPEVMARYEDAEGAGEEADPFPIKIRNYSQFADDAIDALQEMKQHAWDAEAAMIAACMTNQLALSDALSSLQPKHFVNEKLRILFTAIRDTAKAQSYVNYTTLVRVLREHNLVDRIGGLQMLTTILNSVPAPDQHRSYLDLVLTYAEQRALITAGQAMADIGMRGGSIKEMRAALNQVWMKTDLGASQNLLPAMDAMREEILLIQERERNPDKNRIKTGFTRLDEDVDFRPGDLVFVAGRPSMGKTLLVIQFLLEFCQRDVGAVFFSLEMTRSQIIERAMSVLTGIDTAKMARGILTPEEKRRFNQYTPVIARMPFILDDSPYQSLATVNMKVRHAKLLQPGLQVVIIDYLTLMDMHRSSGMSTADAVAEMSKGLKRLAREEDVVVICLSQLNRAVESRESKKPQLSDLRDSGGLEQDADVVIFPYREGYYDREHQEEAQLIIAKNRTTGRVGEAYIRWNDTVKRFENLTDDTATV